jgi:hypothetical protein
MRFTRLVGLVLTLLETAGQLVSTSREKRSGDWEKVYVGRRVHTRRPKYAC